MLMGCEKSTKQSEAATNADADMPSIAFAALKGNTPDRLSEVAMSASDFVALAGLEAKMRGVAVDKTEIESRSEEMARRCLDKAKRSFAKVRKQLGERGFDWTDARLKGVKTRGGPYDPASKEVMLDLFLVVESGGKSVTIKLDDCFLLDGRRKLADGFRIAR